MITRDPPKTLINIQEACLEDSCYDQQSGHLPTERSVIIYCREACNSDNRADQLGLLKLYNFRRE